MKDLIIQTKIKGQTLISWSMEQPSVDVLEITMNTNTQSIEKCPKSY